MKRYNCECCDYHTSNKYDFNKHKKTITHKNNEKFNVKIIEEVEGGFKCGYCNKVYKHQSSLSRHIKGCRDKTNKILNAMSNNTNEVTTFTMNDLICIVKNQQKQQVETLESLKNAINVSGNIIKKNSNKVSKTVFLNEICGDAIGIDDFLNGITLSIDDLEYTGMNGYIEGVTNILKKRLIEVGVKIRSLHCGDEKRLKFYVKSGEKWEMGEKSDKMIDDMINGMKIIQIKRLKEWEQKNPSYLTDDGLLSKWQCIVDKILGYGLNIDRSNNAIKKKLASITLIKNAIKDYD